MNEKANGLLGYLRELRELNEEGFHCTKEISEAISHLRNEFGFDDVLDEFTIFEGGTLEIKRRSGALTGTWNNEYDGPVKVIIKKDIVNEASV